MTAKPSPPLVERRYPRVRRTEPVATEWERQRSRLQKALRPARARQKWTPMARLFALIAGLTLLFARAASAQSVGVVDHPCDALPPMPPVVAEFLAKMNQTQGDHQPAPVPPADGIALYTNWQKARQAVDFGDLCHYDAVNATLPAATAKRVVFFGDSITEFWKARDGSLYTADVLDRGVSGQTTSQMLIRFNADVIDLHPRVVHIMAGTNDIAGNTGPTRVAWIKANIRAMVQLAKANHIRVVLASIPPAAKFTWRPELKPIGSILTVNAWLRSYARDQGLIYVDYYSALDDGNHGFKAAWTLDGVHPNATGYAVMDPLAKRAIDQAMAR